MLDRVQKVFEENLNVIDNSLLIIGVSGGADSLTLLDILVKLDFPVIVAHFDHNLRPEAGNDAQIVEGIAARMRVPFILGEADTLNYARENGLSIEEAARELRYCFLFEQAEKHNAQAVVVAHHADDQVETVLMHLLRGAGLDGLTGMGYCSLPNPWSETIPLMRPLLNTWRTEIETYCATHGLTPLIDATNTNTTYFRNRLRHKLIPELETYVSGFRARLWQTANLLTADRLMLDNLTDQAWQDAVQEIDDRFVTLDPSAFIFQPLALRRRLIRKLVTHLRPGARDVDFAMVQRALDFAENPTATGQADLGLGLRISLERDGLTIGDWDTELPTGHWPLITEHYSQSVPGELDLGNGWTLQVEIQADIAVAQKDAQKNCDPYRAWIDLKERYSPLDIRPRHQGDRFQPLGMGGKSMKISDFMINEKIPQRARAGWPLICMEDEIIWVPGYRLAHPYRVTEKSQQILLLTLQSS